MQNRLPSSWTEVDYSVWFLTVLSGGDSSPIELEPRPSFAIQIQRYFDLAPAEAQTMLKNGLIRATGEWREKAHGFHVLVELVLTAAYVKASGIVTPLRRLLASDYFLTDRTDSAQYALDRIISVLCGFSTGGNDVRQLLGQLFWRPGFEVYGAQLLRALSIAEPDKFPIFAKRFDQILEKVPTHFDLDFLAAQIIEDLGVETVAVMLPQLVETMKVQPLLMALLKRRPGGLISRVWPVFPSTSIKPDSPTTIEICPISAENEIMHPLAIGPQGVMALEYQEITVLSTQSSVEIIGKRLNMLARYSDVMIDPSVPH